MSKKNVKNLPEDELKNVTGGFGPTENPNDPSEPVNDSSNNCSVCGVLITNTNNSSDVNKCRTCYLNSGIGNPINPGTPRNPGK